MPLSPPVARTHRHTRTIELKGYERDDGLWDIEARLVDQRAYEFSNPFRGVMQPGEHLHEMWLRLTLDDGLTIRAVEACTEFSPFPDCPNGAPSYERLVGLRIGHNWTDRVKERIPNPEGCTHLFELLRPMATAAIQTIMPLRRKLDPTGESRPPLLDTCHGWRAEGIGVQTLFPKWHRKES